MDTADPAPAARPDDVARTAVAVWTDGDDAVWVAGEVEVWVGDEAALWVAGEVGAWVAGDVEDWVPGDVEDWVAGDVEDWVATGVTLSVAGATAYATAVPFCCAVAVKVSLAEAGTTAEYMTETEDGMTLLPPGGTRRETGIVIVDTPGSVVQSAQLVKPSVSPGCIWGAGQPAGTCTVRVMSATLLASVASTGLGETFSTPITGWTAAAGITSGPAPAIAAARYVPASARRQPGLTARSRPAAWRYSTGLSSPLVRDVT
jgi:hypothetical protein